MGSHISSFRRVCCGSTAAVTDDWIGNFDAVVVVVVVVVVVILLLIAVPDWW